MYFTHFFNKFCWKCGIYNMRNVLNFLGVSERRISSRMVYRRELKVFYRVALVERKEALLGAWNKKKQQKKSWRRRQTLSSKRSVWWTLFGSKVQGKNKTSSYNDIRWTWQEYRAELVHSKTPSMRETMMGVGAQEQGSNGSPWHLVQGEDRPLFEAPVLGRKRKPKYPRD